MAMMPSISSSRSAFENRSKRISLAELIVLNLPPARSLGPYFLPCFARKPAVLREPDVSQDILVGLARSTKKLPLRIYLAREQGPRKCDWIGLCPAASGEMDVAGLGVDVRASAIGVVNILEDLI